MSQPKPEMNPDFCVNWQGDRKTKFCRQCATEGSSCFTLWKMVQQFATEKFVLVNPKQGHRYQLLPPKKNPLICYLQTLQDKRAHFGLSIEDFLYVAKTGLGSMYETPSRTKQQPFVSLILEQIGKSPDGIAIIDLVRAIPPKK